MVIWYVLFRMWSKWVLPRRCGSRYLESLCSTFVYAHGLLEVNVCMSHIFRIFSYLLPRLLCNVHYFELSTYWDDAPTWISFKEVVQFQRNFVKHAKKMYPFKSISFVLPRVRKSPCSELPTNHSLVLKWLKLSMNPIVRSGLLHSESC